ncbi:MULTISPECIES: hypothetical protein [Saccharothrix]|uniref:hypothetical protein n=1 Tax=Saccharothrix TaxID=2071 RepID=UPI0018E9B622|nr:hypothetical protein [Saccharothrix sp. CB00851]
MTTEAVGSTGSIPLIQPGWSTLSKTSNHRPSKADLIASCDSVKGAALLSE